MKAIELLDSPEKWTKGHGAVDKTGQAVAHSDAIAVRWCLAGALCKCYPTGPARDRAVKKLLLAIPKRLAHGGLGNANDAETTTFGMIRRWLRKAGV